MLGFGADSRVYEVTGVTCRRVGAVEKRYTFGSKHVQWQKSTRKVYLAMISQTEKSKFVVIEKLALF